LKPLPLILGRSDTSEERKKKTRAELLKLTAEEVEKLKKKANECDISNRSRPYSRFEAVKLVLIYRNVHLKHVSLKRINKVLLSSMLKSDVIEYVSPYDRGIRFCYCVYAFSAKL
jgi:hypothetical protein